MNASSLVFDFGGYAEKMIVEMTHVPREGDTVAVVPETWTTDYGHTERWKVGYVAWDLIEDRVIVALYHPSDYAQIMRQGTIL